MTDTDRYIVIPNMGHMGHMAGREKELFWIEAVEVDTFTV